MRRKFDSMLNDLGFYKRSHERGVYLHEGMNIAATAHRAGTARFGTAAATSVLDVNCKAHELDNLYVVDSSFFVSIGAVNPLFPSSPTRYEWESTSWPGWPELAVDQTSPAVVERRARGARRLAQLPQV